MTLGFSYANDRREYGESKFWEDFQKVCDENKIEPGDSKDIFYIICKHFHAVDNDLFHCDFFMNTFNK